MQYELMQNMGKRKEEIISEANAVIRKYRNLYYGKNSEMGKDSRNENEKKGKSLRHLSIARWVEK